MSHTSMAAQNKAALDYFVQTPVSRDMVSYLAQKASSVIRCEPEPLKSTSQLPPTPPATPPPGEPPQQLATEQPLPSLEAFITSIVEQSHVQVPTLLPTLVYLSRLQARLPPVAKGMRCTVHRIFLASLILSAKNLNDSSPKNKHWARYTSVPGYPHFGFSTCEVNLMEKQLLYLLNWDLRITNDDLYTHFEPFLAPIRIKQQEKAEQKLRALIREQSLAVEKQRLRAQQFSVSASTMMHQSSRPRQLYDTPQSLSSSSSSTSGSVSDLTSGYRSQQPRRLYTSRSSSRAPSRTPSLSPPSCCESSAASSSYADSIPSASPASFANVTGSSYEYDGQEQVSINEASYEPLYSYVCEPEVVHLQPSRLGKRMPRMDITVLPAIPKYHAPPGAAEDKPSKKLKTGAGNLFSRFLGGSNSTSALPPVAC